MPAEIVLPLLVGLAIFFFGMRIMEIALHRWAGDYLTLLLEQFTRTPLRGLLTGAGLTALLQSSSVVGVITIGMVNAQILTFPQTLGVILGTNIGTAVTTELIGLDLQPYHLPLLLVSSAVWLGSLLIPDRTKRSASPHRRIANQKSGCPNRMPSPINRHASARLHTVRSLSLAAAGFACILMGMDVMQKIGPALQSRGMFAWFLQQSQQSLLWGVLAGAALTAVIQSSAATIAMAMGLAAVDAIPANLGIAIMLGANVGTCSTAFIASVGSSKYGQWVAWSHFLLNVGGALLFFPLIEHLYDASAWLSERPSAQIAHAQTIFNIACSLLALPFCYLPVLNRKRKR